VSQRDVENEALTKKLLPLGLRIKDIPPDGNCLYNAISDQLQYLGHQVEKNYFKILRNLAAKYMIQHPDDFMPFIDSVEGMVSEEGFKNYCDSVANTAEWGGQLELKALVHSLRLPIIIYTAEPKSPNVEMGSEYTGTPLRLSFHRHAYALGEHYNSVIVQETNKSEID